MHSATGSGLSDSTRWPQRPTGDLAAFSPRPPPSTPDAREQAPADVIGLREPEGGGPGMWTTPEEDTVSRFFLAHGLPLLAAPVHARCYVRSFQSAAGTERWQSALHAALTAFADARDGACSINDGRPWAELLPGNATRQSSTAAYTLEHTTRPPTTPDADTLEHTTRPQMQMTESYTKGIAMAHEWHSTRPPQMTDAHTLEHTTRPPLAMDAAVENAGGIQTWCAHVTVAATDERL